MKKEIIWNVSILIFGIFLAVATVLIGYSNIGWNTTVYFDSPIIGFWNTILFGLIIGFCIIIFRYVNIGILSIKNKDLKLLVLLLAYCIPFLFGLLAIGFSIKNSISNAQENIIPVQRIQNELSEIRKAGMFKGYDNESDKFLTSILLGNLLVEQSGWIYSGQYLNSETGEIHTDNLLRLDTKKVIPLDDTEIVYKNGNAYSFLIEQLGATSELNFEPKTIREIWESDNKPKVTFKVGEIEHEIYPKYDNDWADLDTVIRYVNNKILKDKDYKFYYADSIDILIIGLSKKEKDELTKITGIEYKQV